MARLGQSQNLTADGAVDAFRWPGGLLDLAAQGTFGGGTLIVEWSLDGETFTALADHSLTETGRVCDAVLAPGYWVRASLSGATAPDLTVVINRAVASSIRHG